MALMLTVPLAFGTNAIAAYVLHVVAAPVLEWPLMGTVLDRSQALLGSHAGALIPPLLFLFGIWLCLRYLQRHGWVVKI